MSYWHVYMFKISFLFDDFEHVKIREISWLFLNFLYALISNFSLCRCLCNLYTLNIMSKFPLTSMPSRVKCMVAQFSTWKMQRKIIIFVTDLQNLFIIISLRRTLQCVIFIQSVHNMHLHSKVFKIDRIKFIKRLLHYNIQKYKKKTRTESNISTVVRKSEWERNDRVESEKSPES